MAKWAEWQERIEALDEGDFEVTKWESDFLANLLEDRPPFLSDRRVEVLERMCEKYGVTA